LQKIVRAKAVRIRVVELPGLTTKGDLSDWVQAGGTGEELLGLITAAEVFEPGSGTICIGGQNVHLKGEVENDGFEAPETENEDPPISDDPAREKYLRQLCRNAAKVIDACSIILRLLGFEKNHTRLLNALISIGGDRLRIFKAYQISIREPYASSGREVTEKTVQRDIKKLREEQQALGVLVISYTPGSKDFAKNQSYPCRFQNYLLRYALQAINIAIDTRDDFDYSREALEAACQQVIATIPRTEVLQKEPETNKETSPNASKEKLKAIRQTEKYLEILLEQGKEIEIVEGEAQEIFFEALGRALKKSQFVEPDILSSSTNSEIEVFSI
jgi:hypothetical protein